MSDEIQNKLNKLKSKVTQNRTQMVEVKKCNSCLSRKELKYFDYKDKVTGKLWGACIECRQDQKFQKRKKDRDILISNNAMSCTKCKETKSLDNFTPKKNFGYYVQCTLCRERLGK